MSSDLVRKLTLGELGDFKNGANFSQDDYGPGYPIINVKQLYGGRYVDLHNLESLGKDVLKRPEQLFIEEGDILFARSSVKRSGAGQCALVPANVSKTIFSGFIIRYRLADKHSTNPMYLSYLLQSPTYREIFPRIATGTTISNLSQDALRGIEVLLPSKAVQDESATILGQLDDRIALLRETNATLEAIAQALFKSWFVDFDPVRAKRDGRAPEGMDEATAALFPDSFEDSELGEVPRGWAPCRLDDILELSYGKALKADGRRPGPVPVYGSGGITGWHDTALVVQPSIIVGRKGTVGSVYWESRPFFPIDTVFYVKSEKPMSYCFELLKILGLQDMNTDAAVPGLNRENVYRLLTPKVPAEVIAAFDAIVGSIRYRIDHNSEQAGTLTTLRDTLLPRLISGQLRLSEATGQALA